MRAAVTDKDDFKLVQRKQKVVFGTKKVSNPLSPPRTAALFVYRINKNVADESIKNVLVDVHNDVLQMEQVSQDDAAMASYKVINTRDKNLIPTILARRFCMSPFLYKSATPR